jgi:hypothetical protein
VLGAFEAQLCKAASRAALKLARDRLDDWRYQRLRDETRVTVPWTTADALVESLTPDQAVKLRAFLDSPDFEQLAMQLLLTLAAPTAHSSRGEVERVEVRGELRECLRHATGLGPEELTGITDVVYGSLRVACVQTLAQFESRQPFDSDAMAAHGYLAAMAARNIRLLQRVDDLAGFRDAAARLGGQVAALHAQLRLPHTGTSRSVPWDRLYVPPVLVPEPAGTWAPALDLLTDQSRRTVVLGDPGAGKSTLAARLAHQIASAHDDRVPFLVVLRNVAEALRRGERTLVDLLTSVARDPYHVELSTDAVEYLLYSGRAVVLLDGLDELTDVGLRRRVVELVNGFASYYPLVPVVVTSRRIGYLDAPLMTPLFRTAVIAPLDTDQVRRYATNWYALDESAMPHERHRLCQAFLRESESIADLRSNPLLLSLLCAMYASEQYIPRNRAQIYERCALMVFERWDSMRGIAMPPGFHGQVRGAVRELAWQMFAVRDVSEMTRHKVVRVLTRFLEAKRFDPDEAQRLAEEFLAFCTGRAWVLAEVGATDTEPIYGFAHRTFLEFFAAEHLVRRHPLAETLWAVLRPRIEDSQWRVVTQLALQLFERNVEDGAERLVDLALAELAENVAPVLLAGFLADAAGQVGLSPAHVTPIVDAAVDAVRLGPMAARHRFRVTLDDPTYRIIRVLDAPLWTLLHDSLDGNLPYIREALYARLSADLVAGDEYAVFIADHLGTHADGIDDTRVKLWDQLQEQLRSEHPAAFDPAGTDSPWRAAGNCATTDAAVIHRVFDRHGPVPFYLSVAHFGLLRYPDAMSLLVAGEQLRPQPAFSTAHVLRDRLLSHPAPWLPATEWRRDWPEDEDYAHFPWELTGLRTMSGWPYEGEDLATLLVLCVPYLETAADRPDPGPILLPNLWTATLVGDRGTGHHSSTDWPRLPDKTADFLQRWARREISVIG